MRQNYSFKKNSNALLEPYDAKVSCTVLRGESPSNGADLLDISAGYGRMKYDSYYWYDPCNAFESHTGKNYWGPTKLKASLIWRF